MKHNHEPIFWGGAFIDLEKSYDWVPRSNLWNVMTDIKINGTTLKILNEYYVGNVAYVKIGKELWDPFEITKGLRQGCSLSPILFNTYVEKTRDHWKKSCQAMGVPIEESKCLCSLNYADDQVIIAQDAHNLEFILKRLNKAYKEGGLTINLIKR